MPSNLAAWLTAAALIVPNEKPHAIGRASVRDVSAERVVGADKVGVGKTTVARSLLDYLTAENLPVRAFDTEFRAPEIKRKGAEHMGEPTCQRRRKQSHRRPRPCRNPSHSAPTPRVVRNTGSVTTAYAFLEQERATGANRGSRPPAAFERPETMHLLRRRGECGSAARNCSRPASRPKSFRPRRRYRSSETNCWCR